jgi:protein SCO1
VNARAGARYLLLALFAVANAAELPGSSVYQLQSHWQSPSRKLELRELRDHFQAVVFIFTRCRGTCPLTVKNVQFYQRSLAPELRARLHVTLVSFDPDDSPQVLARYQRDMSLDADWTLLHGSEADVRELAAVLGVSYRRNDDGQYTHSNLVTLLDPQGNIAGQFAGDSDLSVLTPLLQDEK